MNLGSVLRKLRKDRKLTLKTVAVQAGISEGFLSQIENEVNTPSVETLVNICSAIGYDIGDVIRQAQNQERLGLIRKTEWDEIEIPASGFATQRFLAPETRRVIDSAILKIEPGKSIPARKGIRNSQEVLCVLKGSIELVHGEEVYTLQEGDAVHYWSLYERQMITNRMSDIAIVMWVGTI